MGEGGKGEGGKGVVTLCLRDLSGIGPGDPFLPSPPALLSACSSPRSPHFPPSFPPAPPPLFRAQSSITLQWRLPHDNGSQISSFRLERDDGNGNDGGGDGGGGGGFQLVYAGPNITATAEGLRSGLRYAFRLLAENDVSVDSVECGVCAK